MLDCRIRLAEPKDLAEISKIHTKQFERGWSLAEFENLYNRAGTHIYIVDYNSYILCALVCQVQFGEFEIISIFSSPTHSRNGYASYLINEIEAKEKLKAPSGYWILEVSVLNTPALGFYNKLGFNKVGLRKDYYKLKSGGRADALILRRDFK